MLEIRIKIDEIDYSKVVAKLLPMALESAGKNEDSSAILQLMARRGAFTTGAAKAAIALLPQSTREHLAVTALNNHKDDIINLLENLAGDNGIDLKLGALNVRGVKYIPKETARKIRKKADKTTQSDDEKTSSRSR